MEIGQRILFDLETWPEDDMVMLEVEAEILNFCHDPLGRHESKCSVRISDQNYGIPFSNIKRVLPAIGEQLNLF